MSATATEIKRHITSGATRPNDSVLCLAEIDGTSWATNRFWAARTAKLAPLLDKFNIDAQSYGRYEVNGSIHKTGDDAPKLSSVVGQNRDYPDHLTRLTTAAGDAYARQGDNYLALFTTPDGSVVAVRADWLEWLSEAPAPGYGKRYGPVRYGMKTGAVSGAVAVIADLETEHGGNYDDNRKWVPVTWTSEGPVVLAIVLTVRTGS